MRRSASLAPFHPGMYTQRKKIKLNKIGLQFLSIIAKSPTPSTVLL